MQSVSIDIGDASATFDLDFEAKTWQCQATVPEHAFPLIAEVGGKRFQLYSDGTFGEEELP